MFRTITCLIKADVIEITRIDSKRENQNADAPDKNL